MADIVIRPLADNEERQQCVRLQEETWGEGFADRVPSSILMIASRTGGIASGAFQGDQLIGFVFGISGFQDGRRIHWSDMLAVRPEYRDQGIGYRLKLHQRDLLLRHGVETILWTFDPLVARNAYLNLRRLGALAGTYHRDLYGRSSSPLHQGIGTDRLLAEWWIGSPRVAMSLAGQRAPAPNAGAGLTVNPVGAGNTDAGPVPGQETVAPAGPVLEIVVPSNIQIIKDRDPGLARAWRENVRSAFEAAFEAGYHAVDLARGQVVASYLLERRSDPASL